jgi:hypothetical protein
MTDDRGSITEPAHPASVSGPLTKSGRQSSISGPPDRARSGSKKHLLCSMEYEE